MKNSYIRELILCSCIIISFPQFILECLKGAFEANNDNNFVLVSVILFLFVLMFIVNYCSRVIKIKNKETKILCLITPIIAMIFSIVFVNGTNGTDLWLINIMSIILGIGMIFLYNLFVYCYFEKQAKPIISLIIYNIISIALGISDAGVFYLHHYYLGMLIVIIPLAIIEMLIKTREKKNKCNH